MKKKKLIENLKSILEYLLSFVLVIGFISWWSTIYINTLISFQVLFFISFLISIPIIIVLYKKGFDDLLKEIYISPMIIGLILCLSSFLFLSINYIPIGEPTQKEYKIHDAYTKINRKKKYYVKIKWRRKSIELRMFPIGEESIFAKKKLILETERGLLGFDIIKKRKLK